MRSALLAAVVVSLTSCGGSDSDQFSFRIYDPSGRTKVEVMNADIVRTSVSAVPQGGGKAILSVSFTADGASKFCRLTRALARRGAALDRQQRFALVVNGRVQSRPFVDYDAAPSGLCGSPGIEVQGVPVAVAQE
jgi:hypothetical protein